MEKVEHARAREHEKEKLRKGEKRVKGGEEEAPGRKRETEILQAAEDRPTEIERNKEKKPDGGREGQSLRG